MVPLLGRSLQVGRQAVPVLRRARPAQAAGALTISRRHHRPGGARTAVGTDTAPAAALATILVASATPSGYTITIWSSGALLLGRHGVPGFAEVIAFAAGALVGFALLALLAHRPLRRTEPLDHGPDRVLAGMLNWLAVGAAAGSVELLARLHGWLAWPLASFAATVVYLLATSAQLAFVSARRR